MSSSPVADLRVVEVDDRDRALEEISKQAPDAEKLLTLCAFLAPDDIPRRMLLSGAEAVPEAIRDPIRDSRAMIAAVSALTRFGLLDMQLNALGMHRVRQEAVRERLPLAEQRTWAMAAAKIVLHSFPSAPEPSDTWAWAASSVASRVPGDRPSRAAQGGTAGRDRVAAPGPLAISRTKAGWGARRRV